MKRAYRRRMKYLREKASINGTVVEEQVDIGPTSGQNERRNITDKI